MKKKGLYEKLIEYSANGRYPFHMPGHKRNGKFFKCNNNEIGKNCVDKNYINQNSIDPYDIDITEIDGFDNLHDAKGVIKEAQSHISDYLNTKESFFLVNGSTCGILSAIWSVCNIGDEIIVARNCHKAVYNAIMDRNLHAHYLVPDYDKELNIWGGINPKNVEEIVENAPNAKAVVITSPTYEGVISDIKKIAEIVHKNNMVLIVDEAHGAHLKWFKSLGSPAYECGADIVIESVHKTLPGLTQTGILHVNSDRVDVDKIKKGLSIYESSSPSYILMASIEKAYSDLINDGERRAKELLTKLDILRKNVNKSENFRIIDNNIIGKNSVYGLDLTKVTVICNNSSVNGEMLASILREKYNMEVEMVYTNYVLVYTTISDNLDVLDELEKALLEIDQNNVPKVNESNDFGMEKTVSGEFDLPELPQAEMSIYEACTKEQETVSLAKSVGRILGDYVMVYPPGAPVIVPGEVMDQGTLDRINDYIINGLDVIGIKDKKIRDKQIKDKYIKVVK